MIKAGDNLRFNGIYERYIPVGWKKCGPDCRENERERWIRAKYEAKMFLIGSTLSSDSACPYPRVADFFAIISTGSCAQSADEIINLSETLFHPVVTSVYPDNSELQFPQGVVEYAFPEGLRLHHTDRREFLTFVYTDFHGIKYYGSTLIIYEVMATKDLASNIGVIPDHFNNRWPEGMHVPKALMILSRYPLFHLFREFLGQLYRISMQTSAIPLERYVVNFISEVPLPPQGRKHVHFTLPDRIICIRRPRKNQLPMVDFSFRPLFTCLSIDNILAVYAALCAECNIWIHTSQLAVLTPVQEALLSFLFPLKWQGSYIPLLPDHLPLPEQVPFLVGTSTCRYMLKFSDIPNLVTVNLDEDRVAAVDEHGRPCGLPDLNDHKAKDKLRRSLMDAVRGIHKFKVLENCGKAFPLSEHLSIIKNFYIFDNDVNIPENDSIVLCSSVHYSHPVMTSPNGSNGTKFISLLDPSNNTEEPRSHMSDGNHRSSFGSSPSSASVVFNATEVRKAFLRFLVTTLLGSDVDTSAKPGTYERSPFLQKLYVLLYRNF